MTHSPSYGRVMTSQHGVRRVIIVVLDGLRADAVHLFPLPNMARLAELGAATFTARTVTPSVTAAAMTSLFTGVTPDVHGLTSDRSVPSAVLVALVDEGSRDLSDEVASRLRARGIPTEVAATAQKFGKQIRYAERRGIPFVWFPGQNHEVKDIRSGAQVAADPDEWNPPADDLRPHVKEQHP